MSAWDSQSPDGLLIAAAAAGEEAAFAIIAQRYQGALLRAAISRLARRDVAEDVVQETLLCAHRWLDTYDSKYSFRTWLWTILLNQCARQSKREARHGQRGDSGGYDDSAGAVAAPGHTPLEAALVRERSQRLHALLAKLPVVQADALRLRFFGGLTFPEIAAAMGCSEAGAKHRVKTGLLKLAAWLADREISHNRECENRHAIGVRAIDSLPDAQGDAS